jgi:hypothetical protein
MSILITNESKNPPEILAVGPNATFQNVVFIAEMLNELLAKFGPNSGASKKPPDTIFKGDCRLPYRGLIVP